MTHAQIGTEVSLEKGLNAMLSDRPRPNYEHRLAA